MNINHIFVFTGCLSLINNTLSMFILNTIQSSSLLINDNIKRRSYVHSITPTLNLTNDSISLSTNKLRILDPIHGGYNIFKDGSNLTKTQIKVIVTVVIIISLILFIIAIFRFKNACRDQETQTIQTEIIRHRVSQYSEPSARRGSIGYYTHKYIRTPSIRFDEQLNSSSSIKRSSVPTCDQLSKPTATVILSSLPIESSVISTTKTATTATVNTHQHHHYVKSSCDTSNNTNNQPAFATIKPIVRKSCSAIGISRCDDQTPLLTSELASTIKNSSNRNTRKYSLNAFLPLSRSSNSHPFSSSSTTAAARGSNNVGDVNKTRNSIELKPRRRVSLSSALRRNSFAKQLETFQSTTVDSPPITSLSNRNSQSGTADSDNSDKISLRKTKISSTLKNQLRKKSSSITPIISSASSYRKDFMQKIERFRFIDDSASSTTTVTSPVESIDRINCHQPCSHLITSAIEQFDDYVRSRYHNNNDDIESYIDRLNSDILTNGSYSDLNILNSTNDNTTIQDQPQTIFKPVNNLLSQTETGDYHQVIRNSTPITIPSSHSKSPHPSKNSIQRPTTITTNGHSRSMDFKSTNNHKYELHRPNTLINNPGTIYETSSSSIATLTSVRSSTSLEFDDDSKPSGVLVDDDFLPMSSPVDDHFWDMTIPTNHYKYKHHNNNNNNTKNGCFPNVGSSPDIEIKHFDPQQLNPLSSIDQLLSETSCDEDDDNNHDILNQQKFSIHEYKLKELQKPIVIHRSIFNPSIHSIESTNHNNDLISIPIKNLSLDRQNDESLLERFASSNTESVQIPIRSPPLRTTTTTNDSILLSQQYPQTIYEEDDTQESSTNDNVSDESADNGEIDLVHEFELSQKQEQNNNNNNLWSTNDRDIFILQEDDILSALVTTPNPTQQISRPIPPSIMKITQNKSIDSIDEQQTATTITTTTNSLKPKVRFNLDPQYEREREWNKVNKLLGNSVEWTDEFEV